jgi:hypothetical protein
VEENTILEVITAFRSTDDAVRGGLKGMLKMNVGSRNYRSQ